MHVFAPHARADAREIATNYQCAPTLKQKPVLFTGTRVSVKLHAPWYSGLLIGTYELLVKVKSKQLHHLLRLDATVWIRVKHHVLRVNRVAYALRMHRGLLNALEHARKVDFLDVV